ncbi:MAG TPA: DUF4160 domain-containing protein [Pyrinomonadaceae bacterium]|jgi:hypothetical protein|nr:DUF4160 domain-containing protein [Pyrinomonadaceae bacterium]
MPTILRRNGFVFRVYTNDHRPPHVHVIKGDGEVIIELGDENSEPLLRQVYGMRDRDVASAFNLTVEFKTELLEGWRRIHERGRG